MSTENSHEKALEAILTEFQRVHPREGGRLRDLLENTPELRQRLLEATATGNLQRIDYLDAESRKDAYGTYDPEKKSIQLPMDQLLLAGDFSEAANRLRTTVGHEAGHAIQRESILANQEQLTREIERIVAGPSPHDYTEALKAYKDGRREHEARDEIGGVNILAAHVRRENPEATQSELYAKLYNADPLEMQSYLNVEGKAPNQTFTPKEGLTFNERFQIEPTKENLEAIGRYFYDDRGTVVGDLDYLIEHIGKNEQTKNGQNSNPPEVRIDLDALGLGDGRVTLPPNIKDSSATVEPVPQTQSGDEPESRRQPGERLKIHIVEPRGIEETPQQTQQQIQSVIDGQTPQQQIEALRRWIAADPAFGELREAGRAQYEQLEAQKALDTSRLQTTSPITEQEPPPQETAQRRVAGP
jgi:hypothetical protein